ncbi:MAG: carboxylating nicotinate-nucleotide diphosphorylase [Chloroflexi bacterium]|nr:carboxylating nicotinate-nucleotide diphosphorylase [Chloroflexota bacterium]
MVAPARVATPSAREMRPVVEAALAEDLAWGDITTDTVVGPVGGGQAARGDLLVKVEGVLAGLPVAALVFTTVDPAVVVTSLVSDGTPVMPGTVVAQVRGPAGSLLRAERVALNLLQRLSGIASITARYVAAVQGTRARVIDTRKTTPGLRVLEKYAVRAGGGHNHRFNLADGILIKDNHLLAAAAEGLTIGAAIARARAAAPHTLRVEVEVETLDQLDAALAGGADVVLLDNMSIEMLRAAVARVDGRALTEASGGITLATIGAVAATGVDLISVGALTHSAPALDISLDLAFE